MGWNALEPLAALQKGRFSPSPETGTVQVSGHLSLLTSLLKVTFPEAAGYQGTSAGGKGDSIDLGWTMCQTAPSPFLPHISKEDHFRCLPALLAVLESLLPVFCSGSFGSRGFLHPGGAVWTWV